MPNAHSGSVEQLLQRALELGLIDRYEHRGDRVYIEAASLQIELTETQALHWLEAALDAFLRMQGGLKANNE
ncbi:hypothetical protein [Rhodothermus marinus]|uniref:Uncharacterized protein n=1 Tax=Rhodothermus marinus (strain ATCC 43812 / DSM 4252 / R-10) TaxID=518766 RepID=D0MFQ2_RHOM4|nr:hypothetical protein [Rhodothermus marinus]ACY47579.1 hypothetical protein Rmar_0681 [Rhodothermus marinus DSM 4252]